MAQFRGEVITSSSPKKRKFPKRSPQNKKVKYKRKGVGRAIGKAGGIKSRRIY